MSSAKLEFDVEMSCASCENVVTNALKHLNGVHTIEIDLQGQKVMVETSLPSSAVQEVIESTGRKAILKGLGSASDEQFLGAAVAALTGPSNARGVVRFLQKDENLCIIDGTVDGLTPGEHGLHVYEYGDLSDGGSKLGGHYNPKNKVHGGPTDTERHDGDLGNIIAAENTRTVFRFQNDALKVWDIIGRSLGITEYRDDYGTGQNETSQINGNSGKCIAYGIIARSAGLFQNPKRLCQCSGLTVWDERDEALKATHSKI